MYDGIKMRAVLNSLMAALVVTALFLGNCFSCPQVLLAAQRHHCCPHSKSAPSECKTQGLSNFVKAEQTIQSAPAIVIHQVVAVRLAPECLSAMLAVPAPSLYTPPDFLPLRI